VTIKRYSAFLEFRKYSQIIQIIFQRAHFKIRFATTWTGLIVEISCEWCAAGKFQTGVGLTVETDCTPCAAGKYQTGSGLSSPCVIPAVCIGSHST
jgi:hypothetical protein